MQIFSNSKNFFTASLVLFMLACNSNSAKEKKVENKQTDTVVPPQPKAGISDLRKCFANDGLNYKTFITINFDGVRNEVSGNVTSEEIESGKKVTTPFEGTSDGIRFTIKFKGTPPVIGTGSEWTDKPWTIKHKEGKGQWMEQLFITFNAKNYDTNKWENSDYLFAQVECK